jgi:hypothetical protein
MIDKLDGYFKPVRFVEEEEPMSKRVTVKGTVVAADRDDDSLRLSMSGNDLSTLLRAGAFLRTVEVSLPSEDEEPEQPAPWDDKGTARRMINERIEKLRLVVVGDDQYLAHQIRGEIVSLTWCMHKFTEPPK